MRGAVKGKSRKRSKKALRGRGGLKKDTEVGYDLCVIWLKRREKMVEV